MAAHSLSAWWRIKRGVASIAAPSLLISALGYRETAAN